MTSTTWLSAGWRAASRRPAITAQARAPPSSQVKRRTHASANDDRLAAQSIVAHPVDDAAFLAKTEAVDLALKPSFASAGIVSPSSPTSVRCRRPIPYSRKIAGSTRHGAIHAKPDRQRAQRRRQVDGLARHRLLERVSLKFGTAASSANAQLVPIAVNATATNTNRIMISPL